MSKFLTRLDMDLMVDPQGIPLKNRGGEQLYQLNTPLIYQSDVAGITITVPAGFVTDLASIPRLPFIYLLLAKVADLPGVVHDWAYSTGKLPREMADRVLREACLLIGVPAWKATAIYWGVRVGGASHYGQKKYIA